MSKIKISAKELRTLGYPESPVIPVAMNVIEKHFKHHTKEEAFEILKAVLQSPKDYATDEVLQSIADKLLPKEDKNVPEISLNNTSVHLNIFGGEHIEQGALHQMNIATKLPIALAGALMPDAHQGYGLPIGGVLATENAIIPYGVGVDIGCRMCLSVFDIRPEELDSRQSYFAREINENTLFGAGREFKKSTEHEVLERKEFYETALLRNLQSRAAIQLGSSGSGNHFVEFGIVEITDYDAVLQLAPGKYIGLLSHSGSRALGANIANHYTKIAKQKRLLPKEATNLSWLMLDEEEGIEYWKAMNLAGDYASACHHVIHEKISKQIGQQIKTVENHHNFAWKEIYNNKEVIVHRKGATPAGKNVLGIIPGSMTAPGFIVKGKGEIASLNSASHGAGRKMSRTAAMNSITQNTLKDELEKHNVKLMGGGLDEAPQAYKDIEVVMKSQQQLVDTVGKFYPRIVKMDEAGSKAWRKMNKE